jgi:hypothetical protein
LTLTVIAANAEVTAEEFIILAVISLVVIVINLVALPLVKGVIQG